MPDIGEVPWETAGYDEDGIDADVVALARKARRQALGGDGDPAQAILVERHRRAFVGATRLDLDERDYPPSPGHQIDFTAGHSSPHGQDPPAVEAQPPGRQTFGAAAALLGNDPPVQRLSSKARA